MHVLSDTGEDSETSGEAESFSCVVDTDESMRFAIYSRVLNFLCSLFFVGREPVSVLGRREWKRPAAPTQLQRSAY